jgi:hypothetical protein
LSWPFDGLLMRGARLMAAFDPKWTFRLTEREIVEPPLVQSSGYALQNRRISAVSHL